ncbi:MAG: nucleotidyltransferase domain-containing protein [Candidatus Doudnabacteria bacterium]
MIKVELASFLGFYTLPQSKKFIRQRLVNYRFGLKRERLIKKFLKGARHVPFIRGVALAGSQALGLQRATSDIDLLIITDQKFMWLGRLFLTVYFQVLGIRRHDQKIANRFCLNHYLANPREVDVERNLYKAMEYTKLRSVVYPQIIAKFQLANLSWIKNFYPNVEFDSILEQPQSVLQKIWEVFLNNRVGKYFEKVVGSLQLRRIKQEKYIFVKDDELSFHPGSKHEQLLKGFYK